MKLEWLGLISSYRPSSNLQYLRKITSSVRIIAVHDKVWNEDLQKRQRVSEFNHLNHYVVCSTIGPQALPKRFIQTVQHSDSPSPLLNTIHQLLTSSSSSHPQLYGDEHSEWRSKEKYSLSLLDKDSGLFYVSFSATIHFIILHSHLLRRVAFANTSYLNSSLHEPQKGKCLHSELITRAE